MFLSGVMQYWSLPPIQSENSGVKKIIHMTLNHGHATLSKGKPIFSFGVIADIQYADIDDGHSFHGIPRYYRHSLQALQKAIEYWNNQGALDFVIQFGDIVDGKCPRNESNACVLKIVNTFNCFNGGPVYHMLGNHCLYNLPRSQLNELLQLPTSDRGLSYYAFTPRKGFKVIVLDGYDISTLGWPEEHPHVQIASHLLATKNPNVDKNSPNGLHGKEQRFVKFNGGIGKVQLAWLEKELEASMACDEKVIVCCHIPFHPDVTFSDTLLWNYEEVLMVIHKYDCVIACFTGHNHVGGYAIDAHGIHHRVLEAVLECPPGSNAFGHVEVFHDRISLVGNGIMTSMEMPFKQDRTVPMIDDI